MARLTVMLTLVFLGGVMPAWAVDYYLDPDWTGTKSGTQAEPFATFAAATWTAINTSLASGDVTVYMSARDVGSDTNDVLSATITINGNKTANPTGTLTINGRSFYNTNDSTPSWTAQTGTGRAQVIGVQTQNAPADNVQGTKYSKWTIDGLHIVQSVTGKAITICGDNVTIKNSDISANASGGDGPLILLVPTSDDPHEGSINPCPPLTNVTIEDNVIHDSYGELIYLGGAGCTINDTALSDTNCNGKPSHSNVSLVNNTLFDCGSWAPQGDCIDMKAALTNVTIRGNDISASGTDGNARAIVAQGIQTDDTDQNIVIERNYIHDHTLLAEGAVVFADSWGTPNGYVVRNNIFDTNTSGSGIRVYRTQTLGVFIYNNTIYNSSGTCITTDSPTTSTIRNNACLANNGGGAQVSLGGTVTSTNNAYGGTWSGACTSGCISGLTSAAFTDVAGGDFTLTSESVLKEAGITVASFSDDYIGTTRPQGALWDIGAYEFIADTPAASVALSPAIWVGSLGAITGSMIEQFLVPFLSTAAALIVAILVWEARGTILGIIRFVFRLVMFPILLLVPPIQRVTRKYLLRMAWTVLTRPSTTPPPEQPQAAREPDAPRPSEPGEKHEHGIH